MSTYVILTEKTWHKELTIKLQKTFSEDEFLLISKKEEFNYSFLEKVKPSKIFIPHWSYIIPKKIFENFECIVFHMTDLPFGRGGSPLQNLIVKGIKKTKISALKVEKGLDTGDIYLKEDLYLNGSATEIFKKSTLVIEDMIKKILRNNPVPKKQEGDIIEFKRRLPEESNINNLKNITEVYDYIRMLDAEGYPHAYIKNAFFKFEFVSASFEKGNEIIAKVKINRL